MGKRVVITGMGCVTPAGNDIHEFWNSICNHETKIKASSHYYLDKFSTNMLAEVDNYNPEISIKNKKIRRMLQRGEMFGISAAAMAIEDSGIQYYNEDDAGLFLGCTKEFCDYNLIEEVFNKAVDKNGEMLSVLFAEAANEYMPPLIILQSIPNACIEYISELFKLKGANAQFMTTGTSSIQAIGSAYQSIKSGECTIALAGGFDSLKDKVNFASFDSVELMAVSKNKFFGPFDKKRSGFALGEGAGVLFLEEYEQAMKRGAHIYAEIASYYTNMEAKKLIGLEKDGISLKICITKAINLAGIDCKSIDYINAYAAGTWVGDLSETTAIKNAFGRDCNKVSISSIKGTIGHLIGGSGSVELIATALAIENNTIPPTRSVYEVDELCDLDYTIGKKGEKIVNYAAKISRGMGGQNAVIILKKVNV